MLDTRSPFDVSQISEAEAISPYVPRRSRGVSQAVSTGLVDIPDSRRAESGEAEHPAVEDSAGPTYAGEASDAINHPRHYTSHPSGVECIQITEWMNFNLGNAMKYIWRSDEKGATIEDLKKARWYLDREIDRLNRLMASNG